MKDAILKMGFDTFCYQVKIASAHRIPFLATGGGHGVSVTLHNIQNGIEIDLSQFKNVSVDAVANTLTIGGANTFGDAINPLYDAGKEMRKFEIRLQSLNANN